METKIDEFSTRDIEKKKKIYKAQTEKQLTLALEEKENTIQSKENYYNQSLKQAQIGFYLGVVGACIGLIVIVGTILFEAHNLWSVVSGVIIEAVSLLIFKMSDNALIRMEKFFDKLSLDSDKLKAIDLVKSVKNIEDRDELSIKLSLFLIGIEEERICIKASKRDN